MDHADISLYLAGDKFRKDNTSLHELLVAYGAFEGLIESTYSTALGISRFSDATRKDYQITIRETRDNSWDTVFELFMAIVPSLWGNPVGAMEVLATVQTTWEFIKCVFNLKKDDVTYQINNDQNGNVTVNTVNGDQYNFNAPISINLVSNAESTLPEYRKYVDLMERGSLESFRVSSSEIGDIVKFGSDETDIFDLSESASDESYDVGAEIYRYNKRSRTGKLQVQELQEIPSGKYSFKVHDPDIQDDVIISMIKRETDLVVRPVVFDDPITGHESIRYLEIVRI